MRKGGKRFRPFDRNSVSGAHGQGEIPLHVKRVAASMEIFTRRR
jgi:hypothetical protein